MARLPFRVLFLSLIGLPLLAACGTEDTPAPPAEDSTLTIVPATQNDIPAAVADAGLDTLTRLLRETGLADSLHGEGPYTLFAPSDLAFTQLPGGAPDAMSPTEMTRVLSYHIIPGRFETSSLAGSMDINTLQGGTVAFSVDGNATVRDAAGNTAHLVTADMNVDNGVIHIIDRVLSPGGASGE